MKSQKKIRTVLGVQQLEMREVPATLVSPTTLSYQDIDGDNVKVRFSKPILNADNVNNVFSFVNGTVDGSNSVKQQLASINLVAVNVERLSITTNATKSSTNGGDGLANLGFIQSGKDLAVVKIDGDLRRIEAGDNVPTYPAVKSLTAQSMGTVGSASGEPSQDSFFGGNVGSINVLGDAKDVGLYVGNQLGRLRIGGSLIGTASEHAGTVQADSIGSVFVGGDVIGCDTKESGRIYGRAAGVGVMNSVFVGGDVIGSGGDNSGQIWSSDGMGAVRIVGDVVGGAGENSGQIFANQSLKKLTLGGNLQGGDGESSGRIDIRENAGTVQIKGNVVGGSGDNSGTVALRNASSIVIGGSLQGGNAVDMSGVLDVVDVKLIKIGGDVVGGTGNNESGAIYGFNLQRVLVGGSVIGSDTHGVASRTRSGYIGAKHIGSLTISKSLVAGIDDTTGNYALNGAIKATDDIGTITIGSILGNATNPAQIIANGQETPQGLNDVAIGRITVLENMQYTNILAGYSTGFGGVLVPTNADAQIGTVTVRGDWLASSIAAGVVANNGSFGDGDDAKIVGAKDVANVLSKINSVTIGGTVTSTINGADFYGIVAENVGALKVGKQVVQLQAGQSNDEVELASADEFMLNEV